MSLAGAFIDAPFRLRVAQLQALRFGLVAVRGERAE